MKILFDDPFFDGQLLRALSYVYYGGADISECLTTAQRISDGDFESWYTEWYRTAERVYAEAEASRAAGHSVSARQAYLRSSNYFRTSFIVLFGTPVDPRLVEAFDRQTEAFRKAAALFSQPVEGIQIPYEDTTIPGYFYRVDDTRTPRQTLIVTGGYDGTVEELYFAIAAAALRRGYNCLCFDGPGQGAVLIKQQIYFRPDWENVVRPVVNYALTRPEIDPKRIALYGGSWGGYLAPRAATGEQRLAACIADPGQFDLIMALKRRLPLPKEVLDQFPDVDPAVLQPIFDHVMSNPTSAWPFKRGLWVHGADTLFDLLHLNTQYSLVGVAQQISCPTLVCQAESDPIAALAPQLYEALTCPKRFVLFTNEEGAGEHCEAGARSLLEQRVFDWLDEILVGPAGTTK